MRPFETFQQTFILLGGHPRFDGPNIIIKMSYIFLVLSIFTFQFLSALSDAVFIYKYIGTDLEGSLCALFQFAATSDAVYMICNGYINRKKVMKIIESFEQVYQASKWFSYQFSKYF